MDKWKIIVGAIVIIAILAGTGYGIYAAVAGNKTDADPEAVTTPVEPTIEDKQNLADEQSQQAAAQSSYVAVSESQHVRLFARHGDELMKMLKENPGQRISYKRGDGCSSMIVQGPTGDSFKPDQPLLVVRADTLGPVETFRKSNPGATVVIVRTDKNLPELNASSWGEGVDLARENRGKIVKVSGTPPRELMFIDPKPDPTGCIMILVPPMSYDLTVSLQKRYPGIPVIENMDNIPSSFSEFSMDEATFKARRNPGKIVTVDRQDGSPAFGVSVGYPDKEVAETSTKNVMTYISAPIMRLTRYTS